MRFVAIISVLLCSSCQHAPMGKERRSHETDSGKVFDRKSIKPFSSDNVDDLLAEFQLLVSNMASRHNIIRWTVSAREFDLGKALPEMSLKFENPNVYNGDWYKHSVVAQFLYMEGVTVGRIKVGERIVERVEGVGTTPVSLISDQAQLRLESFQIGSVADKRYGFYVTAKRLPSMEDASDVLRRLMKMSGARAATLVVRPDSLFGPFDGPAFNVFRYPYPDVSERVFFSTKYVYCKAGSGVFQGRDAEEASCSVDLPTFCPGSCF